jgi:predicted DNA-binding transcriptional regulator YafY
MRASRLLSILLLVQQRGRVTAQEVADEFGISVRTAYRDLDELSASGVPLQSERGPGGGFCLLDGYRTRLTGLASQEAEAMFMIGLPGPAAALGLGEAAVQAGRKLLAALPPALSGEAGRMAARFHLDPVDWYRVAEPAPHVPALARAVLDQHPLEVTYASWTGTRRWRWEPLGLVLKAGAWYVVAHAGRATRIFKASNVLQLAAAAGTFARPPGFELAAFWQAELVRFEASLRPSVVALRASALGMERLGKLGAYAAAAVSKADAPDRTGWARVALPMENVEQVALLLLGLGPEIEVLEPIEVRRRLHALARGVLARRPGRAARPRRAAGPR